MFLCGHSLRYAATNNALGDKVGVSQGNIFKPATVADAAKNGGVSSIATVDKKVHMFQSFLVNTHTSFQVNKINIYYEKNEKYNYGLICINQ